MFDIMQIFKQNTAKVPMSREEIASLLKTTPEALDAFERAYAVQADRLVSDNFFDTNAKDAAAALSKESSGDCPEELIERIVNELLAQTKAYIYKDGESFNVEFPVSEAPPVTMAELHAIPEKRPALACRRYLQKGY